MKGWLFMGRKLLKILLIFSLLFSIYNFKEDINNSFIISFAQSQKDEDKPKEKIVILNIVGIYTHFIEVMMIGKKI